jgi:hypothetical protein
MAALGKGLSLFEGGKVAGGCGDEKEKRRRKGCWDELVRGGSKMYAAGLKVLDEGG